MKRNAEELLEEISDFLVVYLKSGRVGLNSFIKKTDLPISQMDHLLKIHFLLKEEVKQFVGDLPKLIRRFKTSTTVKEATYHGQIKGQINWAKTINSSERISTRNQTIFTVNERNREYAIKENLVLLEVIQTLHSILFHEIDSDYLERHAWFNEWKSLKEIVHTMLHKNIYLSRVKLDRVNVTDRMILDTLKHRNPLYRRAASILQQYRKILSGEMDHKEVQQLLRETFVYPKEEDVLFELYWVMKLIQQNSENATLHLMDGRNNLVAQWDDNEYMYKVYHDSAGSTNIKFSIETEEVTKYHHPFIDRKVNSMMEAHNLAKTLFGQGFDTKTYWSGRPDIIVEVYDRESGNLEKIVIGEVKHTTRVEYAITGLRELVDYMNLIKDKSGQYVDGGVEVQGMLFTDRVKGNGGGDKTISIMGLEDGVRWYVC